jgi:hypothetical protein
LIALVEIVHRPPYVILNLVQELALLLDLYRHLHKELVQFADRDLQAVDVMIELRGVS